MKRLWWILAVLALLVLAGGLILASRWSSQHRMVDADQPWPGTGVPAELAPGQPVGQTFVAKHAGLSGIEFYLQPEGEGPQSLTLHLRQDHEAGDDLASVTVALPPQAQPGFYRFDLPSLDDSHGGYYYAFVEMDEGVPSDQAFSALSVPLAGGEAYLDGAAYQNHIPLDAQTTFRLVYASRSVILDLLKTAAAWPGLLLVAGLLYVVPGWALLAWFWPGKRLTWAEMLGLATGLSLAVYPLLLVWTDLVGLHLGALTAWLPILAGLAALVWRYRSWRPGQGWKTLQHWARSEALWPDLALLMVLILAFAVRMLVVGTLQVPMWGDSYHHTLVSQLLVDGGGLFESWKPYVPLKSFTYHFGFHTAVALYHWLTGGQVLDSMIVVGQIVNLMAVLSLYPLATKIGGSRWTGVVAVLVAGLGSPMPMYYVNWGRYVQLAGQVVLPVALWLLWSALETEQRQIRAELLAGLAAAGLLLTHYRVTIYFITFVPLVWIAATLQARKKDLSLASPLFRIVVISLTSLLLVLPWIWRLFAGLLPQIFGEFARSQTRNPTYAQAGTLKEITTYVPPPLLITALLGLVVGLVRKRGEVLLAGLWVALWFLVANPNWLGLPGAVTVSNFEGVINNFTVLISLYMPVSILCGYVASSLIGVLPARPSWLKPALAVGLVLVLSLASARQALTTLQPRHTLVTTPDVQAMNWIREHTPEEARFLANSFFAYEDNIIVGSDAGWWIPYLAGRANTVPPMTYGQEASTVPDYIARVNGFAHTIQNSDLGAPETLQVLADNDITHVYIGQKGGTIPVDALLESDAYDLLYHKDRVWIFGVQ